MNSFERFSEDKQTDKCKFYTSLKDECISEKDYLKANSIWNVLKVNAVID